MPNKKDTEISIFAGKIPSTPIVWPSNQHKSNQIQQTKGSAKPQATGVLPTTQPSQSTVAPRTTPAHVSAVRVISRNVGGQKNITVQFNHPMGDPYFSGANVYLRKGGNQPVLVASGAKSPLTFTATNDSAPHAIHVTSVGNWGETDVLTSPAAPVKLFGPLNVSKNTGNAFASGGAIPAPPPGVTDELIHGQGGGGIDIGSWESDPAYVLMRDDFLSAGSTAGGISTGNPLKIGDLGWSALAMNGNTFASTLGAPPNLGTFNFSNVSTASEVLALVLTNGSAQNSGLFYNDTTMALLEYPSWKATFIWKTDHATSGTRMHNPAQKAIYIGFVSGDYAGSLSNNISSRPNTFIGLRFDTSVTPGTLSVTAVANASGTTTVYTITSFPQANANGLVGTTFTTTNCGNVANDVTALCVASTTTSITLVNSAGVAGSGLTGSAAGPGPINDSFYTFEVVDNVSISSVAFGRNNLQGQTKVTNVAPVSGVWHRLDIVCLATGVVTMTLDGSVTNTATFTVPVQTLTVVGTTNTTASVANGSAQYAWNGGPSFGGFAEKWTAGSIVTFSGFTSVYNGTFPINRASGSLQVLVINPLASGSSQPATAVMSGYPALIPTFWFGNDDTASPPGNDMSFYIDFYSFVWNPGVGGGSATPSLSNSRYFPSVTD